MNTRRAECAAPLPPAWMTRGILPSRVNPCPCLNPRLWGCWPLAPSHSSSAAVTWPTSLNKNGGRRIVAINQSGKTRIVQREQNTERRDFYELLWHTGASQMDAACLLAEGMDWNSRTIS